MTALLPHADLERTHQGTACGDLLAIFRVSEQRSAWFIMAVLLPLADLERTHQSNAYGDTRAISQVCERVGLSTKTGKAAALRERCQQSLGRMFPEVYAYLRKMRTQESLGERLRDCGGLPRRWHCCTRAHTGVIGRWLGAVMAASTSSCVRKGRQ
eukprot:scaffold114393_cov23-Tisochrysis_lutea.AAC.1